MSLVRINWRPGPKELRGFGVAILAGFTVIGGIVWFRDAKTAALACFGIGLVIGAIGLTGTRIALPFYWVWMGIAFVLGSIMSRVVLAVVYYTVVTPIAILQRLAGRDRLQLRRKDRDTYWIALPEAPPKDDYERQF